MFGKSSNQKRLQQVIEELAEIMLIWNVPSKQALSLAVDFANQAASNEAANLNLMREDVNLADLYLSGEKPKTMYGQIFMSIITKYEKQRVSDGVTDKDMYWYWSMSLLEREFTHQRANAYNMGYMIFVMQSQDWPSLEVMNATVAKDLNRTVVKYGLIEPENLNVKDKTRLLSFELYKRIETFRQETSTAEHISILSSAKNQNAMIRQQLAKGLL